jgi:hypothetical protein|tara:strand:+ start:349 stop:531 length:183 start_codon:yes stop_codon:yes gene_type:complete
MRRKNIVLEKLDTFSEELDRLYQRIPEDTNQQFDQWLSIIRNLKSQLDLIQNFVELEEEE